MKRLISILLAVVMSFALGTAVFAEAVPYSLGDGTCESILVISGNTASCTSTFKTTSDDFSKVEITQSLEKHSFLWVWDTVGGEWNKTSGNESVSFTNKVTDLDSGTYRVKSVFKVTDIYGKTETSTVYNSEKKVG